MIPDRQAVQDLLRVPLVLRMIRGIIDNTPKGRFLPTFERRGDLYLETSIQMLERALKRRNVALTPERFRTLRHVIGVLAFQMMLDEKYNYAVSDKEVDELISSAFQRYEAAISNYADPVEMRTNWSLAIATLKTIELSHRGVIEVWSQEVIRFRSRKVMEWYAGYYLANHATQTDVAGDRPETNREKSAQDFINNHDWYWTWRFAAEMPAKSHSGMDARDPKVLCRSLSQLFESHSTNYRPTELMYRCWHLFETERTEKDPQQVS